MSSINLIAIKGNHLNRASQIFETFRYVDLNNDKKFDSWYKCSTYLDENYIEYTEMDIALRGIWVDNGWTIICDPEMVDSSINSMESISQKFNSEVLTFLIQTTSDSFEFSKYHPDKQRHFFSVGGQITENIGAPLPEENGLNINENIFVDDILQLAKKFGVDIEVQNPAISFIVKELEYNEEMKNELAGFEYNPPSKTTYLQVDEPKDGVVTDKAKEGFIEQPVAKFFAAILSKLPGKVDPDYDRRIEDVRSWLIEFDNESDAPQREIGLNSEKKAITKDEEYGLWSNSDMMLSDFIERFHISEISKGFFEKEWARCDNSLYFEQELQNFEILSNGDDGMDVCIESEINFNGQQRKILIYFSDKANVPNLKSKKVITVYGNIVDKGFEKPLRLVEARLVE